MLTEPRLDDSGLPIEEEPLVEPFPAEEISGDLPFEESELQYEGEELEVVDPENLTEEELQAWRARLLEREEALLAAEAEHQAWLADQERILSEQQGWLDQQAQEVAQQGWRREAEAQEFAAQQQELQLQAWELQQIQQWEAAQAALAGRVVVAGGRAVSNRRAGAGANAATSTRGRNVAAGGGNGRGFAAPIHTQGVAPIQRSAAPLRGTR